MFADRTVPIVLLYAAFLAVVFAAVAWGAMKLPDQENAIYQQRHPPTQLAKMRKDRIRKSAKPLTVPSIKHSVHHLAKSSRYSRIVHEGLNAVAMDHASHANVQPPHAFGGSGGW